jgi:hypothetical protein
VWSWIKDLNNGQEIYCPIYEGTDFSRAIRSLFRFHPMFARRITFQLHLNDAQIRAIPEQIKDEVLDWACALEAAGVTGDGLSFSAKEKEVAHSVTFNISDSHIEQLNNSGLNQKGGK